MGGVICAATQLPRQSHALPSCLAASKPDTSIDTDTAVSVRQNKKKALTWVQNRVRRQRWIDTGESRE